MRGGGFRRGNGGRRSSRGFDGHGDTGQHPVDTVREASDALVHGAVEIPERTGGGVRGYWGESELIGDADDV